MKLEGEELPNVEWSQDADIELKLFSNPINIVTMLMGECLGIHNY